MKNAMFSFSKNEASTGARRLVRFLKTLKNVLPSGAVFFLLLILIGCSGNQAKNPLTASDSILNENNPVTTPASDTTTGADSTNDTATPTTGGNSGSTGDNTLSDCDGFSFITIPLAFESIFSIIPIGTHEPRKGSVPIDHAYMVLSNKLVAAPIYAPADATLYNLIFTTWSNGTHDGGMNFAACGGSINEATITFAFGHVTTFSDTIKALLDSEGACVQSAGATTCRWEGSFSVNEGDLLGYAGGPQATTSSALDFGMIDRRIPDPGLIGPPSFYKGQQFTVCPFDYFPADMKTQYEVKLNWESRYNPLCGTIDVGIEGKLQGPWFHEDTDLNNAKQNQDKVAGFYPEMRSNSRLVMTRWNSMNDVAIRYFNFASSGNINRNFADVSADGAIYCYDSFVSHPLTNDSLPGHVMVQMTGPKTLKMEEAASGNCPSNPAFSNNAVNYLRP